MNNGVKSVEIVDSTLNGIQHNQMRYIQLSVDMKTYKVDPNSLQVALKLPDEFEKYLDTTYFLLEDIIWTNKKFVNTFTTRLELKENLDNSLYMQMTRELSFSDYSIILIDNNNQIENIRNDSY